MTLIIVCVMLHVQLCFGHRQLGKCLLFINLFLFSILKDFGHGWISFSMVYINFFICKSLELAGLHITCGQKIERLSALIETKYPSMFFLR